MCGIVGILGKTPVVPIIVEALKRLEYRGYDSAGLATLAAGRLDGRRAAGTLRIASPGSRRIRCRAIRASGIPGGRRMDAPRSATPILTPRIGWPSCTTVSLRPSANFAASSKPMG